MLGWQQSVTVMLLVSPAEPCHSLPIRSADWAEATALIIAHRRSTVAIADRALAGRTRPAPASPGRGVR